MKFFSLRWKLTIAFILLGLSLVGSYVFLAKGTFEADKISYVFDTQQNELESVVSLFEQKINQNIFLARSLLATYDFQMKELNGIGKSLYSSQKEILKVELWEPQASEALVSIGSGAPLVANAEAETKAFVIRYQAPDQFVISLQERSNSGELMRLRILLRLPDFIKKSKGSSLALFDNQNMHPLSSLSFSDEIMKGLANDFSRDRAQQTIMRKVGTEDYLISVQKTKYEPLGFAVFTPKREALGALEILFKRSLAFIVFSFFFIVLIALLISRGLTSGLAVLTEAAVKVGKGDFGKTVSLKSRDEMGVLATAFQTMTSEIQRLLQETAEKARMQAELDTAKEVQDTLFPQQTFIQTENLKIVGKYRSASECGGDWWWHWEVGGRIFVLIADATGHGAPAALITSAARSAFAVLEENPQVSLEQVAATLHRAIRKTSHSRRTMSGFILEVNKQTAEVRYVNASHPAAVVMPPHIEGLKWNGLTQLDSPVSSPLGGQTESILVGTYQLQPGERLVLLTDGLTERRNKSGGMPTDRSFGKTLIEAHGQCLSEPQKFVEILFEKSDEFSEGAPQDDDLTLVVVDRV